MDYIKKIEKNNVGLKTTLKEIFNDVDKRLTNIKNNSEDTPSDEPTDEPVEELTLDEFLYNTGSKKLIVKGKLISETVENQRIKINFNNATSYATTETDGTFTKEFTISEDTSVTASIDDLISNTLNVKMLQTNQFYYQNKIYTTTIIGVENGRLGYGITNENGELQSNIDLNFDTRSSNLKFTNSTNEDNVELQIKSGGLTQQTAAIALTEDLSTGKTWYITTPSTSWLNSGRTLDIKLILRTSLGVSLCDADDYVVP